MLELAGFDRTQWQDWHTALSAHARLLRECLPRDSSGSSLDDTARQYVTHLMLDTGVREAQILEVDTGTIDYAIDVVVWSAPDGQTGVWPPHAADGEPGPDGWIEERLVVAAAHAVEDLAELHAQVPLSQQQQTDLDASMLRLRAALRQLVHTTHAVARQDVPAPAPTRATQDWESMAVASRLVGALAAVNATAPDVQIAEPYVQMTLRGDDDAFEVKYRLGYPELAGGGAVVAAERVGLPAVTVALYRSATAMSEHAAQTHGMTSDEVEVAARATMGDTRWWISADPRFTGLVHRVWDLYRLVGEPVTLCWTADGAWALVVPGSQRVDGHTIEDLETELDRRRAIAAAGD